MTDTPHLGLPTIEAAQAQKHVTHNEALTLLDIFVQLAVASRALSAPPASPAENSRYIVKPTGTGAFAGKDNQFARYSGGGWLFYPPRTGWLAFVADEGALLAWNGSAWMGMSGGISELQNLALLGVGTTADTTNPVSAKLNNALWTAKTVAEGGDGHLRYKLSKENAAKTLSFLFQDNFSGRAEIGLTGDDDLHFKVSPDGTTWIDALVVDKTTGAAKINSGFFLTGDISPTQITADQNDYNPAGLSSASVLRLSSDASRNITGLAGGGDGRIVAVVNAGANTILLKDANASSSAANRFSFGADLTLAAKQSAVLWYDATESRWKLLAGPGGTGGGSVSSVFGRTGAVVAASGDYSITQITNAREVLTAARSYFVRTDGSDSNNGLANTAGGAFLTIQKAIDTVNTLDTRGFAVTVNVAAGTYTGGILMTLPVVGGGTLKISGDTTTPSNVVISTTSKDAVVVTGYGVALSIEGVKVTTTTSGEGMLAAFGGKITVTGKVEFGAVAGTAHLHALYAGAIAINVAYNISGAAAFYHYWTEVTASSIQAIAAVTVTVTNSPTFVTFAKAEQCSEIVAVFMTYSGTVTAKRYDAALNAVINTAGSGANYFPGNVAGTTSTGGQYA